jgi:hypothetical protein
MAHPQSNFASTFNGTPLGNAKLTLSVNGVDHEYTPSGNDQAVDINGNEVVHIDDPDFVQLLNVADADKCELIIKQDITADDAYRKYRLADCHVLDGNREWRFTCTAGNIEYILTVTENGSVTPSQRLIPGASDDLPLEDGTASAGTSNQYSRKDHVHPHDSTKEDASNKTSYIDPTIDQSGKYLGGSAVNGFVEKRTFAISVPYGTTNSNTFTKILEFSETFDDSRTVGSIFTRLKIQYVGMAIKHRLREVDVYIGYDLRDRKSFVTFGNCYNTVAANVLKKLHVVTYDDNARRHIEVYLEHVALTSTSNRISVEVCENFKILEQSWGLTQTSHSSWKMPLASYDWDEVNGASIQPTAAALPTTGVLKTDSYIVQSGNQAPFTYVPYDVVSSTMPVAKLVGNPSDTRLVFKLYSSEGWVAIGKVERANNIFKLSFSAISDKPDFDNGVATPYIYLSLLDGVYFVNVKIDSYHTVAESIAIEVENENKDWEFFGSTAPDSIGSGVARTDTDMKADLTAEVIDQGTNVPAPTPSTKVLTKQVDANGREFWKTEQMSNMTAGYFNHGSGNAFDALSATIRTGPSSNHGSFQLSTAYTFANTTITLVPNQWYQYRWSRTANSTAYGELELCRVTGNNAGQLEKITVLYDNNVISAVYREVMASGQVGSPSVPVYVDANGQVQPCRGCSFTAPGTYGYISLFSIKFTGRAVFSFKINACAFINNPGSYSIIEAMVGMYDDIIYGKYKDAFGSVFDVGYTYSNSELTVYIKDNASVESGRTRRIEYSIMAPLENLTNFRSIGSSTATDPGLTYLTRVI